MGFVVEVLLDESVGATEVEVVHALVGAVEEGRVSGEGARGGEGREGGEGQQQKGTTAGNHGAAKSRSNRWRV